MPSSSLQSIQYGQGDVTVVHLHLGQDLNQAGLSDEQQAGHVPGQALKVMSLVS